MKQFYLLFFFLFSCAWGMAQPAIFYGYDYAGNRVSRKIVMLYTRSAPATVKKAELAPVEDQLGERKVTVYPNPTQGALAVEITGGDAKDAINLTVFSAQGVQLQSIKVETTTTPIDMSPYPDGWYILRIQTGDKAKEFKIIKQ